MQPREKYPMEWSALARLPILRIERSNVSQLGGIILTCSTGEEDADDRPSCTEDAVVLDASGGRDGLLDWRVVSAPAVAEDERRSGDEHDSAQGHNAGCSFAEREGLLQEEPPEQSSNSRLEELDRDRVAD